MSILKNEIIIPHEKFIRWFWRIIGVLVFLHIALQGIHYYVQELPWLLREILDMDEEESFATWFSSIFLFISSILLFSIAHSKENDAYARHWYGLALGFCLLSVDEVVGVHETFNTITEVAWTVPATWVILIIFLIYLKFLFHLPPAARKQFLIAGSVFLGGGLLVEHLADFYVEAFDMDNFGYQMLTAFEEFLEMAGVVLFIKALGNYLINDNSDVVLINIKIK